jgi:uncharacterized membrane protein
MIPHLQFLTGVLMLAIAALVAWSFWMLPLWSRPGIYFAVTVAPEFRGTPEAQRLLRSYRLQAMIHVAIAFALILAGALPGYWPLPVVGAIWLAVGPLTAFIGAHKKVHPHAFVGTTVREAVLEHRDTRLPGGWLAQLGPFAILLAGAVYLYLHWDAIPARFPVHWGLGGQPDRWSVRTPMGVYAPILTGALLLTGLGATAFGILHSSRSASVRASQSLKQDFAHRVAAFVLVVEYFLALCFCFAGLLPLAGATPLLVAAFLMLPALLFLIAWLNKGHASFENGPLTLTAAPVGDGTLDKYWKLGVFYCNPDDAALFVEKRFGVGYTVNFGHVSAWIIMALVLLLPLVLVLTAMNHR